MSTAAVNGATPHYTERGIGTLIVLVHGGLGVGQDWDAAAEPLAKRFRVITPDSVVNSELAVSPQPTTVHRSPPSARPSSPP